MSFSENFINIMDAIGKQLGIAIDWTSQNVVPYIEQLSQRIINYEMCMHGFYLAISVAIIITGKKIANKAKELYEKELDEGYAFLGILGIGIVGMGIICVCANIKDIITALTLPEKTIVEFIMQYK